MGAQVKTLSFLAYIIKIYQDVVQLHSQMLVQGMLGLLTLCPMEVAHLRRELLIAARHILATELRNSECSNTKEYLHKMIFFFQNLFLLWTDFSTRTYFLVEDGLLMNP